MIKINNLTKTYPNGYTALKGVNLILPSKGLICITGDSGSGKTTLLNCIFGTEEFDGNIEVNGVAFDGKNNDEIRKLYMTMIYQDYQLFEELSVKDNLLIAADCVGIKLSDIDIENAVKNVGLKTEYICNKVSSLSGGEKQRVGIARAIVQQASIILADEPTGNLDSRNSRDIFELLKSLSHEYLIIAVTHNAELANLYADEIIKLTDGEIEDTTVDAKNIIENLENHKAEPRRSAISNKTFFTMVNNTGKNKILLALLSLFSIVFLVASFVTGSFMSADERRIIEDNVRTMPAHSVNISAVKAFDIDYFSGFDDVFYAYGNSYFWQNEDFDMWDNLEANYMKSIDFDPANMIVECNDVSKIGCRLICGRNVEAYDEIVINEGLAYGFLSKGSCRGKEIKSYEDLLGCENKGVKIVGIIDGKYDKYQGEYKDYSKQQFLDADEDTQESMKRIKAMLQGNLDVQFHVLKEGYTEHTRNELSSLNGEVVRHSLKYNTFGSISNGFELNVFDGQEYNTFGGSTSTIAPAENEIVMPTKDINKMFPNGLPKKPFDYDFKLNGKSITLRVIGYKNFSSYCNQKLIDDFANDKTDVYSSVFTISTNKDLINILNRAEELKTMPEQTVQYKSGYTYGIRDIADFLKDYRALFIALFAVSVALLSIFTVLSAYIVLRQKRRDILILRKLGMDKYALAFVYITAFAALGIIQIALSTAIYSVALWAINMLIKNSSAVAFNTIFFDGMFMALISVSMLIIAALFALSYLSHLFRKSIGSRQRHG